MSTEPGIEHGRGNYCGECRKESRYVIPALVASLSDDRQTVKAALEAAWLVTSSWGKWNPQFWTFRHYFVSMRRDLRRFCREVEMERM